MSQRSMGKAGAMDAVVVGAGPNGLAAAITLARAGLAVRVYEAAADVGGGTRTAELTLPGFRHDVCAAVHPLAAGSPFMATVPRDGLGLEWVQPPLPLAHPLANGEVAVLHRSADTTAAGLGPDGGRYLELVQPFLGRWDELAPDVLGPLGVPPAHPGLTARFGLRAALPAAVLARAFRTERARTMLAGLSAHAIAPLGSVATGGVALLFALAAHAGGWPVARGGSQAIADALTRYLKALGGEVVTGTPIARVDELPRARAYLLDVSVPGLIRLAGHRLPRGYLARLRRYRSGPAVFKIDYALSEPVPWKDESCRQAGTVHLGGSFAEIDRALADVVAGRAPDRPFLITSQPTLVDPGRAPPGGHILWAYGQVPFGWAGDLTDAIEAQLERYAPGFMDVVVARAPAGPAVLEARNANNVGGDIACGAFGGLQALSRPVLARVPSATPDPAIYLCSAATPPGPGVHGMCGFHAARAALWRRWGIRIAADPAR
jgi:phytoene dehydrogenase-like protein